MNNIWETKIILEQGVKNKSQIPSMDVLNARDQLGKLVPEILNHFEDVTAILQDLEMAGYEAGVLDERGDA